MEAAGLPSALSSPTWDSSAPAESASRRGGQLYDVRRAAVARALMTPLPPRIGSLLLFHYPDQSRVGDHAVSFQVLPIGPMQTEVRTKWLVQGEAIEGKGLMIEELTHVWLATNRQTSVVEENQIGIRRPLMNLTLRARPGGRSEYPSTGTAEHGTRRRLGQHQPRRLDRPVVLRSGSRWALIPSPRRPGCRSRTIALARSSSTWV